jgi:RHS repeat-associated protein
VYDAQGNVTRTTVGANGATWTFAYDNRNELVGASYSATLGGTVTTMVTFVYDAFGNAIGQDTWTSGSGTTVTSYGLDQWYPAQPTPVGNENFNAWADLNGSNALTMRRMWGPGVDEPLAREDSSGNVGWYLTDYLGNVVGLTNGSGTPLTTITFNGFGTVLSNSTPAQSDRYLKAGSQYNSALGLWQNDVRFTNGAFWYQQDPKGFGAGDPNLYRVVGNNPTNATDPSGLDYLQDAQGMLNWIVDSGSVSGSYGWTIGRSIPGDKPPVDVEVCVEGEWIRVPKYALRQFIEKFTLGNGYGPEAGHAVIAKELKQFALMEKERRAYMDKLLPPAPRPGQQAQINPTFENEYQLWDYWTKNKMWGQLAGPDGPGMTFVNGWYGITGGGGGVQRSTDTPGGRSGRASCPKRCSPRGEIPCRSPSGESQCRFDGPHLLSPYQVELSRSGKTARLYRSHQAE